MDRLVKYTIPFAGMAMGNHQFEYEIGDQFFELFENSVIEHANVHVSLQFHRSETLLALNFSLHGNIRQLCDRCLEPFEFEVSSNEQLLVRFGSEAREESDNIIVISHSDQNINVAQHIYDYLSLALPMRVVHPENENGESTCDPEFLKNIERDSENPTEDPRWDILRGLGKRKN
jgi:uncharacterized protein